MQLARIIRGLLRDFRFSIPAVVILALAFSITTLAFWLYTTVLSGHPAIQSPDQVVAIYRFDPESRQFGSLSFPDLQKLAGLEAVFSEVAGYVRIPVHLQASRSNLRLQAEGVTENYFQVLGLQAVHGNVFESGDYNSGDYPFVLISYQLWQSFFGGRSDVLGEAIYLSGHQFRVLGVLPSGFRGVTIDWGEPPDIWIPLSMLEFANPVFEGLDFRNRPKMAWMLSLGRLEPEATVGSADVALSSLNADSSRPARGGSVRFRALPIHQARFWPGHRSDVQLLLGMFGLIAAAVLFAACLNATSLQLARLSGKTRNLAIRAALGASRWRLVREAAAETLLVYLSAGGLGFLIAYSVSGLVTGLKHSFAVPLSFRLNFDWYLLLFVLGICVACAFLFGAMPVFQASRVKLVANLRDAGILSARFKTARLRTFLTGGQIAISLVLIAAAGLLATSLVVSWNRPLPFRSEGIQIFSLDLATEGYQSKQAREIFERISTRIGELPGVESVSWSDRTPVTRIRSARGVRPFKAVDNSEPFRSEFAVVSDEFFSTLSIPLLSGRAFSPSDAAEKSERVVIVNDILGRKIWPSEDAIGRLLMVDHETLPRRVIGVVPAASFHSIKQSPLPHFYLPLSQSDKLELNLFVRSFEPQPFVLNQTKQVVSEVAGPLPVYNSRSLEFEIGRSLSEESVLTRALLLLSVVVVGLAVVGLYGLVSFIVSQRHQDFAIRSALGSSRRQMFRLVVGWGGRSLLLGVLVGVPMALYSSSLLSPFLDDLGALRFVVVGAATFVVVVLGLAAVSIPARRVARLDPWPILRGE